MGEHINSSLFDRLYQHYSDRVGALITDLYLFVVIVASMYSMTGDYYSPTQDFAPLVFPVVLCVTVTYVVSITAYTIKTKSFKISSLKLTECVLLCYAVWVLFTAVIHGHDFWKLLGWYTNDGALTVLLLVAVVVYVGHYVVLTDIHFIVAAIIFLSQACVVVLQLLGFNPFGLYGTSDFYGTGIHTNMLGAYAGTLGNIGLLGNICAGIAIPLLAVALKMKSRVRFLLLGVAILWVGLAVRLGAQAPILGISGAVIFLIPFLFLKKNKSILIYFGILVSLVIMGMVLLYLVDLPITTLHEVHDMLHGYLGDYYATGRGKIWREAISVTKDGLFFGHGPDMMGDEGIGYFTRLDKETGILYSQITVDPHSKWLDILYGSGIPALLLFLIYCGMTIVEAIRNRENKYCIGLVGGVVVWLISWSFSVSYGHTDFYLYLLLGCLSSSFCNKEHGGISDEESTN